MKILVVGGGGREHAIIKKLRENLEVREVYALPGNGGISLEAVCKPIGAKELEKIRDFAVSKVSISPLSRPTTRSCSAAWIFWRLPASPASGRARRRR